MARQALSKNQMSISELKHLAFVIAHNGLEPDKGFGGCSCDICSLLREMIAEIKKKEAKEYLATKYKKEGQSPCL